MEVDDPAFDPTPDPTPDPGVIDDPTLDPLTPEPPITIFDPKFDPAAVFDVEILSDEPNAEFFVPDNVLSRVDEPIRDCNAEDATVESSEEPALEPTSDPRSLAIPDFDPFAESRVGVIPDSAWLDVASSIFEPIPDSINYNY